MYPIQKQEGSRGIGMGYRQFVDDFASICQQHQRDGRARAFAFVFYDMTHGVVREALKQADGFRRLHDKTGRDVTLFYLHDSALEEHWRTFNSDFIKALGVEGQVNTPSMVFFRVAGEKIEDVSIFAIDEKSVDPVLTVAELEKYVDEGIAAFRAQGDFSALTHAGKAVTQFGVFLSRLREAAAVLGL